MIRRLLLLLSLAAIVAVGGMGAAAAADDAARIEAIVAGFDQVAVAERAKLLKEVAALKTGHDRNLDRERERALRDLRRLAGRAGTADRVLAYRAILRLDRSDPEARRFFEAVGTLDAVLAELDAAAPAPESAVDLLAAVAGGASPAADDPDFRFVTHSRDWPLVPGLARPEVYGGLLTANDGAVIRVPLQLPSGSCYLHIRYAVGRPARPMDVVLDGKLVESGAMSTVSDGWTPERMCWYSVGPITAAGGPAVLELRRSEPSPHLGGVVVSRSPQPPAEDPLFGAGAGVSADQR